MRTIIVKNRILLFYSLHDCAGTLRSSAIPSAVLHCDVLHVQLRLQYKTELILTWPFRFKFWAPSNSSKMTNAKFKKSDKL